MSIHQEIIFPAGSSDVYRALTDSSEFARFTGAPADIDAVEGGAFLCFGTFISGRNIELVPGRRIVQAWRVFNWPEGVYSIVRFELSEADGQTRLVMDQSGVPEDAVQHVDPGWGHKYWEPLRKVFEARDRG